MASGNVDDEGERQHSGGGGGRRGGQVQVTLKKYYWNIVGLQCVSFYCIAKSISYTYTYIHFFKESFPT